MRAVRRVRALTAALAGICLCLVRAPGAVVAADVQRKPLLFYHESSVEPRLADLVDEFDFDTYVSPGLTEFDQMALLKEWVYTHIPYEINQNDAELFDSVTILRRARKGDAFICTNFATVFVQCAVSLGWSPRTLFLRKQTGEEHAATDIWSNQYRKWVYIDPTWNLHVERRGVPLSVLEMRREWFRNGGMDVIYVFGAGPRAVRYAPSQLPVRRSDSKIWEYIPLDGTWLGYTYQIGVVGRNDFFSCCNGGESRFWETIYAIRDAINAGDRDWSLSSHTTPVSPGWLFHDLNRVDVAVRGHAPYRPGAVTVRLGTNRGYSFSPNFMEYLVSVGGGDWKVSDGRFRWMLRPGRNVLRVRLMNRFGVVGPVTVREIRVPVPRRHHRSDHADRRRRH